ncbi:Spc19-domain-containing protein [Hysterangium stoloniferum]|nr:Spc19-domain-containing protein [Hysterangium stoloniferum]
MVFPNRQCHIVTTHEGNTEGEGIWGVAKPAQPKGRTGEMTVCLRPSPCTDPERVIGQVYVGPMLRPSYAPSNGRPRESVFISGPVAQDNDPVCSPYIEACVAAALESCDKLYDAQCSLRRGVSDLPRMSKVLQNERLFVLINEGHAATYQAQLAGEIEPQINELVARAEKSVKHLERKENLLMTKLEAIQSRASSRASSVPAMTTRKLDALTKQREALEKELEALNDEVMQLVSLTAPLPIKLD